MFELPPDLKKLIKGYIWKEVISGDPRTAIFHLSGNEKNPLYLKITDRLSEIRFLEEREKLKWLFGKLPVPRVLFYTCYNSQEFLLLAALKGVPSHHASIEERKTVVSILARGLRRIHSIDITKCPFNNSLDIQLSRARTRMKRGFVREEDFDEKRQGRTAEALYQELLATRLDIDDPVFTHGDYCLPNILIDGGKLSGFVDFGNAGISDRYQDIALCIRSIIYNFGGKRCADLFLEKYGIKPNWQKIEFYQLLDEFF